VPVPFLDEELVIRVHRVVTPVAPPVNPGVRGTLGDISLGTLLSLFEFERKSGILVIIRGPEVSRVLIAEGKILRVEASVGNGAPRERLMNLLDLTEGQFEFSPSTIVATDEIGASVTQLLLEHARTRDEQNAP
jgi:hypothetical protein